MVAFDIDQFIAALRREYRHWNAPVITELSNKADSTPFQILVSTLLSLRTKDQVTSGAAARLFRVAKTPEAMLLLSQKVIEELIYPVGFYHTKAKRLRDISRILLDSHQGCVPDRIDHLLELPGVGRKTANLVLVEGYDKDGICVDTHVHRISNRVGYVKTNTPDQTEFSLRERLPRRYWKRYNEMLVAFGQMICRPLSPFCSRCPVEAMCPRVGVGRSR